MGPSYKSDNVNNHFEIQNAILYRSNHITVRRGINKKSGKVVAIKEYSEKDEATSPAFRVHLKILKLLSGAENIINLDEVYEEPYKLSLTFDFIPEGDLLKKITEHKCFEEKDGKEIVRSITRALACCHKNQILHRDLRVENILCGKNFTKSPGDVYLSSFGRAVFLHKGETVSDWNAVPAYKAPEHFQRKPLGFPSDCWALGVVTYIVLGGYKPFDTVDRNAPPLRTQILGAKVIFHEQEWKDIKDTAKDFIKKLLDANADSRLTAEQALAHPFLQESVLRPSQQARQRKPSIRQINFLSDSKKIEPEAPPPPASPASPSPAAMDDGNSALDLLMESMSASPIMSPKEDRPPLATSQPPREVSPPIAATLHKRRTSRMVSSHPKDPFFSGMEELRQLLHNSTTKADNSLKQLQDLQLQYDNLYKELEATQAKLAQI
uniref:Protein kinase domain-containing protein n=1 Tax=Arcella intermedia TaxID=1963864 RepID=A0A6B2L4K1_9EUKA